MILSIIRQPKLEDGNILGLVWWVCLAMPRAAGYILPVALVQSVQAGDASWKHCTEYMVQMGTHPLGSTARVPAVVFS